MAPPPTTGTLQERLLALAKTLQFAWFSGHAILILCVFRYTFSWLKMNYYGGMAQFSYRTAFVSAAVTYGIVVYKTWRSRQRSGQRVPGGYVGYLADENVQYLLMAIVWLFSPQYYFAMLPYTIYSVFHVATYVRANIIPTIQPAKVIPPPAGTSPSAKPVTEPNPLAERIGNFVKTYYDSAMNVVAGLEILLWVVILLSAITFRRRSWILLALYTAFIRARFAQSSHVQNSFSMLQNHGDSYANSQSANPTVKQAWDGLKAGAKAFHDVSDVGRYVNNGTAVPKKTS